MSFHKARSHAKKMQTALDKENPAKAMHHAGHVLNLMRGLTSSASGAPPKPTLMPNDSDGDEMAAPQAPVTPNPLSVLMARLRS